MSRIQSLIDPKAYRQVLGQYPTGVCVVTATAADGEPIGMVVGSFTSVSLDPPLVAFFPDKGSSSWARLRSSRRFCINILSADQEGICRKLASKDPEKFSGVGHGVSPLGNPRLESVVAWIECSQHSITDAGDHDMVMGRIEELEIATGELPLLFFQGGYGRFAPGSLAVGKSQGLTFDQLRKIDLARPTMEQVVDELSGQCIATVKIGDELAVVASAGQGRLHPGSTMVGQRLPFAPPTGAVHAAWLCPGDVQKWLKQPAARVIGTVAALSVVRTRGFSIGLASEGQRAFADRLTALAKQGSEGKAEDLSTYLGDLAFDPLELSADVRRRIRLISVPVFDDQGRVAFALTLYDFGRPAVEAGIDHFIETLGSAALHITKAIGGIVPGSRGGQSSPF